MTDSASLEDATGTPLRYLDGEALMQPPSRSGNDVQVLVVDDDASIRRLVAEVLREAGHTVFEAERGDSGVAMARDLHPDVIVMDLMLPGINGLEATRQLKHDDNAHDIRVIAMSAVDGGRFDTPLLADAFLRKPFDIDQLLDLVAPPRIDSHA